MIVLHDWLKEAASNLRDQAVDERLPHGLLLVGEEGIGKRELAYWIAALRLCAAQDGASRPCGQCQECRQLSDGFHPDFMTVTMGMPDDKGKPTSDRVIVINSIRNLIEKLSLTSSRGRGQVAVIFPADRMNTAAANALLKTLEEPSPDVTLILTSSRPLEIPPTVASRCQKLRVIGPDWDQARAWLESHTDAESADLDVALQLSRGAPLAARSLIEDEVVPVYRKIQQAVPELLSGRGDPVTVAAGWPADSRTFGLLGHWLADQTRAAALNRSGTISIRACLAMDRPLRSALRLVETTARPELIMEELLAKWTEFVDLPSNSHQNGPRQQRGEWT